MLVFIFAVITKRNSILYESRSPHYAKTETPVALKGGYYVKFD